MSDKKLDEIAIKHASSLRDANSFDNEFTMRHHIRAALDEAVAERDKEWRTALFPNTPTVEFTPEMAAKTVRAFVAEERKALREIVERDTCGHCLHSECERARRILAALGVREKESR
jgi:hypothetical protein